MQHSTGATRHQDGDSPLFIEELTYANLKQAYLDTFTKRPQQSRRNKTFITFVAYQRKGNETV